MTRMFWKRSTLTSVVVAAFAVLAACAGRNTDTVHAPNAEKTPITLLSGMPEGAPVFGDAWRTDPDAFTFAILGDKTGGGHENWPILDRAVEEINRLKPDFVIMVGDQIQGYTTDTDQIVAQWDEFRSHVAPLTMPFMSVLGNHDVEQPEQLAWWKENIGLTYWDFAYGDCAFIMLNTDEMPGEDEKHLLFGEEQIAWAVDALKRHEGALHTFVFMHKPSWDSEEWPPIEEALGDRPRTVIGGHWHNLVYEKRNGHDYIVHGATGAGLNPSPVKEFGEFHHYSIVNVRDGEVAISIHEPGAAWAPSIAPVEFGQNATALLDSTAVDVTIRDDVAEVSFFARSQNKLNGPVTLTFEPVVDGTAWTAADDAVTTTLSPGATTSQTVVFRAPKTDRVPTPRITFVAEYQGQELRRIEKEELHPFAPTSEIAIPNWLALGPFDVGPIRRGELPANPHAGIPGMFTDHPADAGFGDGSGYEIDGVQYGWIPVGTDERGIVWFDGPLGMSDNLLGYATTAIYSPDAQRVPIAMRSDNFSQLFVNGDLVTENYGTPGDVDYAVMNLNAGWNEVLVKLANHQGNWYFRLRLLGEDLDALQFAPSRPTR